MMGIIGQSAAALALLLSAQGVLAADPKPPADPTPAGPVQPPLNASARNIRELRETALSPDGAQVAAVIASSTAEGGQTHVWLLSADGKASRQVTASTDGTEPGERTIAWSDDGQGLFFLAKRGKTDRLYRLPMSGGEAQSLVVARPATGAPTSGWNLKVEDAVEAPAKAYAVSPDSKWIAVIAEDGETAAREAEVKKKDDRVQIGRDDQNRNRLYLVEAATGQAREVALPDDAQTARWSQKSDELLVVTAPADEDLGPAARLWRVVAATGASAQVAGVPKTVSQPAWTDTGFVYFAQCQLDAPPGCAELYAYDAASQGIRNLTKGLTGTLTENLVIERGAKTAVMAIEVGVNERLARIDLATGKLSWIEAPQPVVSAVRTNSAETGWVVTASGPTAPPSLFFAKSLGGPLTRLATPEIIPADWPMTPSRRLAWKNKGLDLQGLLYLPKLADGARAPLVVIVHGGPSGLFQDRYQPLVNLLIAQGWAVLETNPRGSQGYGAGFEAANKNDLGGADYTDIMTGVDAALAAAPLDAARMALVGYSYGGEMAAFVEGRTARFKALVSGAPVIDQFSEYGTEDSSFYDRWYFGKPWEHFADAWRQSPLAKVGQAKTPLLLIQGQDDPTDPLGQSEEMRRAMTQVGVPVVMLSYPRETHRTLGAGFAAGVTREPWHGLDLRRRMIGFIADAFAGKPPAAGS